MAEHPSIIPSMRYRDAKAAIDWLCRAFGFEQHLVVPGEGGSIAHAELTYRNGMIMIGSARDDDFGKLQKRRRSSAVSPRRVLTLRVAEVAASSYRRRTPLLTPCPGVTI